MKELILSPSSTETLTAQGLNWKVHVEKYRRRKVDQNPN